MSSTQFDHLLCAIDKWYRGRCDGIWEHSNGFTLESTDNPGWRVSVDVQISTESLAQIQSDLLKLKAEVVVDSNGVNVWSPVLQNCVQAVVLVLENKK